MTKGMIMNDLGVQFAKRDGQVSTSATGRDVFASAAAAVDQRLADRIHDTSNWRKGYVSAVRDVVAAGSESSKAIRDVADAGLIGIEDEFEFDDGSGSTPAYDAVVAAEAGPDYETCSFLGRGVSSATLSVPMAGEQIGGGALKSTLRDWWEDDVVEASFVHAMESLLDEPDWLDLSGVNVILLGAGAELSPLRQLLAWGADVYAVDLPSPQDWDRIIEAAQGSAGTLHVPVLEQVADAAEDPRRTAQVAGIDLIAEAPSAARWLSRVPVGPTILANYGYADGSKNARLSVACDAISKYLMKERGNHELMLSYLATPTDAFQVPIEVVGHVP